MLWLCLPVAPLEAGQSQRWGGPCLSWVPGRVLAASPQSGGGEAVFLGQMES